MEEDVIVVEGVRLVAKINTDSLIGISGLTENQLALYALGDSHVCFRQTSDNQSIREVIPDILPHSFGDAGMDFVMDRAYLAHYASLLLVHKP